MSNAACQRLPSEHRQLVTLGFPWGAGRSCYRCTIMPTAEVLVLATVITLQTQAVEPMRRVDVYGGLASVEIPMSWQEIPAEALEYFSLRTAESSHGRSAEVYQHGFRPVSAELSFTLPQVLIQIRESGRLRYGRFLHLPELVEMQQNSSAMLLDRQGPLVEDYQLERLSFDRESLSLRLDSTINLAIEGPTAVRSATYLTERGTFTVHCYATESQFELLASQFDRILGTVRFDPAIAYQARLADRWTPRHTGLVVFMAVVLAAAAALLILHRRRSRSAAPSG
jgi:hypothetical protein